MATVFRVSLADRIVGVTALFASTRAFCEEYLTEGTPDFEITVTPEDIAFEREKSAREAVLEGRQDFPASDAYLETLSVYRKIACGLLRYGVLLFHGSVIAVEGKAYLFTAKSGTGKSTHTRLWRKVFGDRAVMVNDDKPLLRITDSGVIAYGTPWNGKHHLSSPIAVPLKAVCILTRSETNQIEQITKREALPMLCQQSYRPHNATLLSETLSLVNQLGGLVPLYRLGCNMDPEAARVAFAGMNEKIHP